MRDFIVGGIRSGAYRASGKLPTERALALQLGAPRSAVRDALAVLESDGTVTRVTGSGTYVNAEKPASPPAETSPPVASPAEIMAARLLLEPPLAHLAAINADPSDFARFDACIAGGDNAETLDEFELWDASLHEAIAASTHNRLVVELYAMVTRARDLAAWGQLKRRVMTDERQELYRRDHRAIVDALKTRDAAAAEAALLAHLERVRRDLLGH